jgi:GNAT superfamily N-acetyltransferase
MRTGYDAGEVDVLALPGDGYARAMDGAARGDADIAKRVAGASDLAGVAQTIEAAFREDPLWSWAIPDASRMNDWWRFLVGSALRYPFVFVAGDYAAASVWIPPGGSELTEHEEELLGPLLEELAGAHAPAVMDLFERFEAAHPRDRPHYYLSLLGTHPEHRGQGLGMALLAENLASIDKEGMPAYLESSNPENVSRYERLGFAQIGEFSTSDASRTVATMWREG